MKNLRSAGDFLYIVMTHINFNGKLIPEKTAVAGAGSRGLRYGDGLFETIKFRNNQLVFFDEHLARLWKGMQQFGFEFPKHFTPDSLQEEVLKLLEKNKLKSARIRLAVYRADGGLYDSKSQFPQYVIESIPLLYEKLSLNTNGLQVCIYEDAKKPVDQFSNLKHNNFLPYFMGAMHARTRQCNDAIILNQFGRICDSTIANIFIIKDDSILTPSLAEGCIAGVMRKFIIGAVRELGFVVSESSISKEELLQADEVFLTNSIFNMKWVQALENRAYRNTRIVEIFENLAKTKSSVFC